jgi:hypothetical protein
MIVFPGKLIGPVFLIAIEQQFHKAFGDGGFGIIADT